MRLDLRSGQEKKVPISLVTFDALPLFSPEDCGSCLMVSWAHMGCEIACRLPTPRPKARQTARISDCY